MDNKLNVSSSPHFHSGESTRFIMLDVVIALCPALIMSVVIFGFNALVITLISVACCVVFEMLSRIVMKRTQSVGDLSAVVTGVLLAFNLPADLPLWIIPIGAFIAIVVVKQFFGGIGKNFVNPALAARIALMISFPQYMAKSQWISPNGFLFENADSVTKATPLVSIKEGASLDIVDMFLGNRPGSLGEVCAAALIIGGVYLVVRKIISPIIPLVFIGTTAGITWVAGQNPIYNILAGGLLLGAIYMATDYTTCPVNFKGKIIYAVGCGVLTAVIRLYGNMPEGVSISILLMNILVPHIERVTTPKPFGYIKEKKGKERGDEKNG